MLALFIDAGNERLRRRDMVPRVQYVRVHRVENESPRKHKYAYHARSDNRFSFPVRHLRPWTDSQLANRLCVIFATDACVIEFRI